MRSDAATVFGGRLLLLGKCEGSVPHLRPDPRRPSDEYLSLIRADREWGGTPMAQVSGREVRG